MQEILILPSSLETVDFSVYDKINDSFDLYTNSRVRLLSFQSYWNENQCKKGLPDRLQPNDDRQDWFRRYKQDLLAY